MYGTRYICEHPVYNSCTLFLIENKGLAVIQQRFDSETKSTWWSEVDPWLTDALYLHDGFREFFNSRAKACMDGLYPWEDILVCLECGHSVELERYGMETVTIRQIMWALKMKPIKRERWETVFDRREI